MIGTDPSLDLPSLSDTLTTIVSKIVTGMSVLADSIADQATPSALNINAPLSMGGNHLTNVGGIILAAGNSPSSAGSLYYTNGNFYLKDATGIIQLTSGGAINLTATGAIGGDYGSGSESLDYDLASQEYRLKASSTLWADAVMDDLVLMEPGASPVDSVRITAQAMSASYTLTLPAAVPSETVSVKVDTSGNLSFGRATKTLSVSTPSFLTYATGGSGFTNAGWRLEFPVTSYWSQIDLTSATAYALLIPVTLPAGCIITGYTLYIKKASSSATTLSAQLYEYTSTGAQGTVTNGSASDAGNATGDTSMSNSGSLSETVTATSTYYIVVTQSIDTPSAADRVYGCKITYTDAY